MQGTFKASVLRCKNPLLLMSNLIYSNFAKRRTQIFKLLDAFSRNVISVRNNKNLLGNEP